MSWKVAAEAHARSESPREACGLVLRVDGSEVYRPCINRSAERDRFSIDPASWAAAEDEGEILAVFHSHPNLPAHPSDHDRVSCTASGLPWHIIGLPDGVWTQCEPSRPPLLGRPFVHGLQDCYSLIRDYYSDTLGIALPDFARADRWWDRGDDLYSRHFASAGFRAIEHDQAQLHDVVIMQIRSKQPNHGGVLLNGGLILHHVQDQLSCRGVFGGYWRKHAVLWLRHRSLDRG